MLVGLSRPCGIGFFPNARYPPTLQNISTVQASLSHAEPILAQNGSFVKNFCGERCNGPVRLICTQFHVSPITRS